MNACLPADETDRLAALQEHKLLDTESEQQFDDLVRLAAQVCGTPISTVTLIDKDRQWFKAITGLDARETPRDVAFCAHTILQDDILIIEDALADPRFQSNPFVTGDPHIRFYAGVPLVTDAGYSVGSLCVIDSVPRTLAAEQEKTLRLLARQASNHLGASRQRAEREELLLEKERLVAEKHHLAAIIEHSDDAIYAKTLDGTITSWNRGAEKLYGYGVNEMIGQHVGVLVPSDRQDELSGIMAAVCRGDVIPPLETARVTKTDGRVEVSLRVSPVKDADNVVIGAFMIARDITAIKTAQAALAEANRALIENNVHLQESEERLRRLTDAAFEGIAISQDERLLDVSPAFAALFGYAAPHEMAGLDITRLAAPGSRAEVCRKVAAFDEARYEPTLQRRDGTTFQAEVRGRTIQIGGRPARITAVRDISERKAMETALRMSQARLVEAQHIGGIGDFRMDLAARRLTWSAEMFRLFEFDPEDSEPSYDAAIARYHPDDRAERERLFAQTLATGEPHRCDMRLILPSGTPRWVHLVCHIVSSAEGHPTDLTGVVMDVTEQKTMETQLQERAERLRQSEAQTAAILESIGDAFFSLDAQWCFTYINAQAERQLSRRREELLGRCIWDVFPDAVASTFYEQYQRAIAEGITVTFEAYYEPLETWSSVSAYPTQDGGLSVFFQDVTERKHAEATLKDYAVALEDQKQELEKVNAELAALATSDGLTGLKNHRAFQERLAVEVGLATRHGEPLSLVVLDVDHFKQYNDTYGHPEGDSVLRAVACALQECVRDTDLAARYGGEEFVIILPQTDLEGAVVVAERVRAWLESYLWPLRPVTASIGVANLRLGECGADLIARADAAMYDSKVMGRNRVTVAGTQTLTIQRVCVQAIDPLTAGLPV